MAFSVDFRAFLFGRTAGKRPALARRRTQKRAYGERFAGSSMEALEPRLALSARGFGGSMSADTVPGNESSTQTIDIGGTRSSAIDFNGDSDWYRVELKAGIQYRFTLKATTNASGGAPLGDPFLYIRSRGGWTFLKDDDSGVNLNASITTNVNQPGVYWLDARAAGDRSTGGYTLRVTQLTPTPADDFRADQLTVGLFVTKANSKIEYAEGTLEKTGDQDWFRVALRPGRTYTIEVSGRSVNGKNYLYDPFVYLRDSEGRQLAYNDDWIYRNKSAKLTYKVPTSFSRSAVYYVDIGSNFHLNSVFPDTGHYKIEVTRSN